MEKIAFFDFDGTLTRGDSFIRFSKFALGPARFYAGLFCALPRIAAWKLGLCDNSSAKQRLFSALFEGSLRRRFMERGEAFADEIDRDLRADVMAVLKEHQSKGHRVCIVTASIGDWIRPWARRHGISDVIATEVEYNPFSGCLTGRFSTPNCHGAEKTARIRAVFPEVDECETWAYGDSAADSHMLELATHGVKV